MSKIMEDTAKELMKYEKIEVCTFLILNISSLQLIPVNMIAYRSQYGSVNPAAIVAAMVSTVVAIVFCKIMNGKR